MKDDFLANTSHELRTPLQGIIGIAESIHPGQDPAEQQKNLDYIVASSLRLSRLVNEILDFSKLQHGESHLNIQAVSLPRLLEQVVPGFSFWQQRTGVALHVELPAGIPLVAADPERLVQTLYNLVGNAFKFTRQGSVSVRVRDEGANVVIAVEDTGPGMDAEELQRIFTPFEQGQEGHRSREGTGLGLSISRKLTELQDGALWASSEPGRGSVFYVRLPVAYGAMPTGSMQMAITSELPKDDIIPLPESVASGDAPCILAIDDEPMNLRILVNHLGAQFRMHTLPDGRDALEHIAAIKPDLVLLDVMMPGKDGYAVCREIRSRYDSLNLPVLFITARSQPDDLLSGYAAGGDDYILKPFLKQELEARIQAQLQTRRTHRAVLEVENMKGLLGGLVKEKFELVVSQRRLQALLHHVRLPLAVIDESSTVVFANQGFADLVGFSIDEIPGFAWSRFAAEGENRLLRRVRGPALACDIHTETLELGEETMTLYFVRVGQENEEWPRWRTDGASSEANPQVGEFHRRACEAMQLCMLVWTEATGLDKSEFAEKSGIWKVHRDENGWGRTATLDKYLDHGKFPKFPKWNKVLDSLDYVLVAARHVSGSGDRIALLADRRSALAVFVGK